MYDQSMELEKYVEHNLKDVSRLYPFGWVPILESRDLKKGHILSISRLDTELVVYRDSLGTVHVFGAYCPHLGANLGIGGTVEGNDIRCPFHGWTFNGDGKCSSVPGLQGQPPNASLDKWTTVEKFNMVWIWYRDRDEQEPMTSNTTIPQYDEIALSFVGRASFHVVGYLQDLLANFSDTPHITALHQSFETPSWYKPSLLMRLLQSVGQFQKDHVQMLNFRQTRGRLTGEIRAGFSLCGRLITLDDFEFIMEDAYTVTFYMSVLGSKFCARSFHVPQGKAKWLVVSHFYLERLNIFHRLMVRLMIQGVLAFAFIQDQLIWQNKIYLAKPHLLAQDSAMVTFRKWFNQFYR